jgi:hypothetical protein
MSDASFTVDPDGLDALNGRLGEVVAGLQGMDVTLSAYDPLDLGPDDGVWHALQGFTGAWSSRLETISRDVSALQDRLTGAAGGYRATESQIVQAASPADGSP